LTFIIPPLFKFLVVLFDALAKLHATSQAKGSYSIIGYFLDFPAILGSYKDQEIPHLYPGILPHLLRDGDLKFGSDTGCLSHSR